MSIIFIIVDFAAHPAIAFFIRRRSSSCSVTAVRTSGENSTLFTSLSGIAFIFIARYHLCRRRVGMERLRFRELERRDRFESFRCRRGIFSRYYIFLGGGRPFTLFSVRRAVTYHSTSRQIRPLRITKYTQLAECMTKCLQIVCSM